MRLGDQVINKYDPDSLIYEITGFAGEKAILKVKGLPLTTVLPTKSLIKIASYSPHTPPFKIIQGDTKKKQKKSRR